jgi:hypothetical protein
MDQLDQFGVSMEYRRPVTFSHLLRMVATFAVLMSAAIATESRAQQSSQAIVDYLNRMTPEQRAAKQAEMRDKLSNMSPEERQQLRDQVKSQWQQLPSEDKARLRQQAQDQYRNLSPDERQQLHRDLLFKLNTPAPAAK